MVGKHNRPRRIDEPTQTWNIVFPVRLIEQITEAAKNQNVTSASLVRAAAESYLSSGPVEYKDLSLADNIFNVIRSEFTYPKYANGSTFGDVVVERVKTKLDI